MTPAVKFLLIANTAVFVVQTLLGAVTDYQLTLYFGLVPPLVLHEFYIWQLFTYQFLHGGLFHLLFNMLAVWMFGCDLERRWGSNFFSALLFYFRHRRRHSQHALRAGSDGPSIGASAGVYGILLAYGLIYPNRIVYFYFFFPIKMKYFVWIIGAIALYSSITAGQSGIAHLAHLGGMVFGYIYLRGFNPWERFKDYLDRRRLTRLKRRFQIHTGGKDETGPTVH